MPNFNKYEDDGRRLMVEFTCQRCGLKKSVPLEAVDKDPESYGHLHSLKLKGWENLHIHGPLLCPGCLQAYVGFMRNAKEEAAT